MQSTEQQIHFVYDYLLRLPHVLNVYEYGGLNDRERSALKRSQEQIIGDKFNETLTLLKAISFFDVKQKIDLTIDLLDRLLGVPAFLGSKQGSDILFSRYSTLPKFWNKDGYQTLHL
ncbi:MAG: hypothetical protein IAX22_00445 [Candidatus Bathyarchaeota archaeon]|nr:hypothetical protein [Candidatus Bathyarchaeota archaeon]